MPDPRYPLDKMNKADGLELLRGTPDNFSKMVIFDPQYREVLDQLNYGNEGERQKGRFVLPQMSDLVITQFGLEIVRILAPSGYCALWADKMILCQAMAPRFFNGKLQIVDLITWDKETFGMGYRSRRRGEHLIILQNPPIKARATWRSMPSKFRTCGRKRLPTKSMSTKSRLGYKGPSSKRRPIRATWWSIRPPVRSPLWLAHILAGVASLVVTFWGRRSRLTRCKTWLLPQSNRICRSWSAMTFSRRMT